MRWTQAMAVVRVAVVVAIAGPTSAWALERACRHDKQVCLQQADRRIMFRLNDGCSLGGSLSACITVVQSALQVWNEAECSDLELVYDGTTPRTDIGIDLENLADKLNLILIQDSTWPYDQDTLRVTTLAYDQDTGDILDFDIEINHVDFDLDKPALHNLLARELGVALGFDYNREAGSIMDETLDGGEELRALSAADVESICRYYPASSHDFTSGCSCLVSPLPYGRAKGLGLLLALMVWGLRRKPVAQRDRPDGVC